MSDELLQAISARSLRWRGAPMPLKLEVAEWLGVELFRLDRLPVGWRRYRLLLADGIYGDGDPLILCRGVGDLIKAAVWVDWAGHGTALLNMPKIGEPRPMLFVGADHLVAQKHVAWSMTKHLPKFISDIPLDGRTPWEVYSMAPLPDPWRREWAEGFLNPEGDPLWMWPGETRLWEFGDKDGDIDLGDIELPGLQVNLSELSGGRVQTPRELGARLGAAGVLFKQTYGETRLWREVEGRVWERRKCAVRRSLIENLKRPGRESSTIAEK